MSRQHLQQGIVNPHDHDVLSGRGNFVNYHAGNEYFRALVKRHRVAYVACPKPQKGKFSKMIVDEIKSRNPPGRFLKQDASTKLWYDIGEKKALDKTRQALREGAPGIKREIEGDDDDDDSVGSEGDFTTSPTSPMKRFGAQMGLNGGRSPETMASTSMGLSAQGLQQLRFNGLDSSSIPLPPDSSPSLSQQHRMNDPQQQSTIIQSPQQQQHHQRLLQQQQQQMNGYLHAQRNASVQQSPVHVQNTFLMPTATTGHIHNSYLAQSPAQVHSSNMLAQHVAAAGLAALPYPMVAMQQQQQQQQQHHHLQQQQQQQLHHHHQQQHKLTSEREHEQFTMHPGQLPLHMKQPDQTLSLSVLHADPDSSYNQQISQTSTPPSGLHLQGSQFQTNSVAPSANPQFATRGSTLEQKLTSLSRYEHRDREADDDFEPSSLNPYLTSRNGDHKWDEEAPEALGPLHLHMRRHQGHKVVVKRDQLRRESSDNSLQIDNIFHIGRSMLDSSDHRSKNAGSSTHLSLMSLSISDVNESSNTDSMPSYLAGSSLRVGDRKNGMRLPTSGSRRQGSVEVNSSGLENAFDMSVATLGDRMSDFGGESLARMTESQNNCSFSNVFDDSDREALSSQVH